jgi:hypothetical protein
MAGKVGNPNIAEAGKSSRFSATHRPKNPGRKPSVLKNFIKINNVSRADVNLIFKNVIFGSSLEELQEMIKPGNKEKLPVIVALLISAFITDMKKGTLCEVNTVLDRLYGKASQPVDINEQKSDIPDDPDERRRLAEEIKKELGVYHEDNSNE